MSSILETLTIEELYLRKENLLKQLKNVESEIKQRLEENNVTDNESNNCSNHKTFNDSNNNSINKTNDNWTNNQENNEIDKEHNNEIIDNISIDTIKVFNKIKMNKHISNINNINDNKDNVVNININKDLTDNNNVREFSIQKVNNGIRIKIKKN